ncbi:nucleotide exchange factor GrpE [Halomonas sp. 18H]|uniref:nucleotide exchange factor GrpE n=1 Tax=Halomonas almeriensis TaxID=308163 RepID=UPI00222E64EA|nr:MULTISPECIES: nucleotide exchange factor GrpE [Halomonas]MCW4153569.1 nucleotide exchange factor GrpE [Halomonas sp. 18H]MDN3552374.1 nucleotide exchange factor GrpE [Halomonas almeriensis]
MAQDPQTPQDEELSRQRQESDDRVEPEVVDGDLEDTIEEAIENAEQDEVESESSDNPEAEMLAAKVEELEKSLSEANDKAMREAAEVQNVRRRAEQETEKARKFALEKFVKELLPVVDSLEKALDAMGEDASEVHREGVSMTLKLQLDVLNKFGVEVVDPAGEPFDPQYHEAVTMVPNAEMDPNSVMEVIQKGYLLNGRLVRPAMVVVSQAAE